MGEALSFATPATGLVTLTLLTGSLILGIATANRLSRPNWPRFALAALHRNISLLSVLFLGLHVFTAIMGPHAEVRLLDVFVPFMADDHPLSLGLGTVALNLLLASVVVGMLRARLSLRLWRVVHWAAYASWPAGLIHGVAIGDSGLSWVIGFKVSCVAAVVLGLLWRRLSRYRGTPTQTGRRLVTHGR